MVANRMNQRLLLITLFITAAMLNLHAPSKADDGSDPQAHPAAIGYVADTNWPMWRGPRGDGSWNAPLLAGQWPESGLPELWSVDIGGGYAGVSVSSDRVITMDRRVNGDADNQQEIERVLCLNAGTGQVHWVYEYSQKYGKLDYGNGPRAAPTVHGSRVITLGALGHLACLDFETGSVVWSHDLVTEYQGRVPMWGYAASPRVYRIADREGGPGCEAVIVQGGGESGHSLLAFDLQDGSLIWKCLNDEVGYAWPVPVTWNGEEILVVWTPTHIRGVDPRGGTPLWSIPYEVTYGVSIATPIAHDGIVLVCGYWHGSRAIQLGATPRTAELLWEENRYLRGLMSQPLYREGLVYLLDKQYGLTCFELRTGERLWADDNQLTPRGRNPQASIVWLNQPGEPADQPSGGRILALNASGELVMARVDRAGYREQARARIIDETWAHPAFVGRRVFARSDSRLVCVELPGVE